VAGESDGDRLARRGPHTGSSLEVVLDLFAEVLGETPGHTDDDFFDLGGNSLLALALLGRLREATGSTLRVREFLSEPTPAGVTRRVDASSRQTLGPPRAAGGDL
jgi:nonribosomal peptide synthetase DhbF